MFFFLNKFIYSKNIDSMLIFQTKKWMFIVFNYLVYKKKIQNIIISRYPILSKVYAELDDDVIIDDVLGINTMIGANIIINDHIVTIYNTTLCADVNNANITNNYARQHEITSLFKTININNWTWIK